MLLLGSGCAEPPAEELNAAESALAGARDAEAATLAPESLAAAEEKVQAEAEAARAAAAAKPVVRTSHPVVRGECLWRIAGHSDVYGDPHQWTRIYNANRDKISNPDLIYPDQVLELPR